MAITFVTGLPGHGKTLFTLSMLKRLAESENRPVFHNDVPGLAIDGWQVHRAEEWPDLEARSYMLIDECQRVFPIRARSSVVPSHVSELETHRHKGIDLYLITQHPMLVDTNVRKLVDRHFHVVRTFGLNRATVYEFPSGVQDSPEKSKSKNGVIRHEWSYPKKAFAWYRSAEVHTGKSRVPLRVWMYGLVALLVPLLMWLVYLRVWTHHGLGDQAGKGSAAASLSSASASGVQAARVLPPHVVDVMSAQEYLDTFRPRIPGLAFTAPVYDHLTKPVEAPYPSVCMFGDGIPCRCWSQRGFSLVVPKPLCEQLAREPMDPYWLRRGPQGLERPGNGGGLGTDRADGQAGPVGGEAQTRAPVGSVQGS
jgi:zona occludens toxin